MELFKLLGTIAVNNGEANEAIDDTTGKAETSSFNIGNAFKKIGLAVATYFTAEKIISFGTSCVEAAASVQALNSQFEQTFGELQDQATTAIGKVAEESGILQTRLNGVGTQIYAFAKSSGADSAEAMQLMETALQATADAAAYYDRSLEETAESLQSFLKGNFANDAALGVSATETTRNAAAMELFGEKYNDLSEIQKQQTLLKMVTDAQELSGAMGQAARESDGWENVMGNLKETWTQFQAKVGAPILQAVVPVIKNITDGISGMGDVAGTVGSIFTSVLVPLIDVFNMLVPSLKQIIDGILPVAQSAISTIMPYISEIIGEYLPRIITLLLPILDLVSPLLDILDPILKLVLGVLEAVFPLLEMIIPMVVEIVEILLNELSPIIQQLCTFLTTYGIPAIQQFIEFVKPILTEIFNFLKVIIDSVSLSFSGLFNFIMGDFKAFIALFSGDWEGMWNAILQMLQGIGEILLSLFIGIFSTFVSVIINHWDQAKGIIQTAWNWVTDKFISMKTKVSETFTAISDSIKEKINLARDVVKEGIEKIKSFFDFEWKLPDLKLPHFKIEGGFSLNPPSVPSFGVDWYAKGGIMTNPTAFGINPESGNLMVGGEAGAEAIAPIATLQKYVSEAVANQNARLEGILGSILEAILALDENMGGNMREAIAGTTFTVNNREFARLVKGVN